MDCILINMAGKFFVHAVLPCILFVVLKGLLSDGLIFQGDMVFQTGNVLGNIDSPNHISTEVNILQEIRKKIVVTIPAHKIGHPRSSFLLPGQSRHRSFFRFMALISCVR